MASPECGLLCSDMGVQAWGAGSAWLCLRWDCLLLTVSGASSRGHGPGIPVSPLTPPWLDGCSSSLHLLEELESPVENACGGKTFLVLGPENQWDGQFFLLSLRVWRDSSSGFGGSSCVDISRRGDGEACGSERTGHPWLTPACPRGARGCGDPGLGLPCCRGTLQTVGRIAGACKFF